MLSDMVTGVFSVVKLVGAVIGSFAILIGGFGIANIMFVSVKDRTAIIGLQKALGAHKRFILNQFIFEAILLCVIGALIGILLVVVVALLATRFTEFTFYLSADVMGIGILVAIIIGLIAGLAPAYSAAKMDPVVALRS